MNANSGWVKLWRDQFNHEISERKPWCDGYAWSYLYSRANHRPAIVNFRNQYINVERGQFVTSKSKLQKIFGWSKKRTNSFLTSLEVGGMCTTRVTNRFVIVTICNYDRYQSNEGEIEPTEGTTEGLTKSQQRATDKNKQNEQKKKSIPPYPQEFVSFWNSYPKKTGKDAACGAWNKRASKGELPSIDDLLTILEQQKISVQWTKDGGQ